MFNIIIMTQSTNQNPDGYNFNYITLAVQVIKIIMTRSTNQNPGGYNFDYITLVLLIIKIMTA